MEMTIRNKKGQVLTVEAIKTDSDNGTTFYTIDGQTGYLNRKTMAFYKKFNSDTGEYSDFLCEVIKKG
ncbi:MAG: hypothetical protein EHM28_03475 [Spirochaetaceae bacterium]|nr:MAG: hypothetical protein EHM28_03475 [Spirochaetaceae bacterium]